MKNRILSGLVLTVMMFGAAGVASATTITFSSLDSAADKTSIYTYFDKETFNGTDLAAIDAVNGLDRSWTWSGTASTKIGSKKNEYAAPDGPFQPNKSNYLSVPNGSVTVSLGQEYNYFGLWWGSIDAYNTISFFNDCTLVDSFTGVDILTRAGFDSNSRNVNGTKLSRYVNFNFMDLGKFNSFMLTSTNNAFEVDNIAVGNASAPVPEPATMILLGSGLAGIAAFRRKSNKK